jgi:hypothetical protein
MPKGPRGEKRPADAIGAAIRVARIATGEEQEEPRPDDKSEAARLLGKLGGQARANKLTKKKRKEIAEKAAAARWAKKR